MIGDEVLRASDGNAMWCLLVMDEHGAVTTEAVLAGGNVFDELAKISQGRDIELAAEPGEASRSCPSPRTMISALAPLSDRKQMNVLSMACMFFSCSKTRPIS